MSKEQEQLRQLRWTTAKSKPVTIHVSEPIKKTMKIETSEGTLIIAAGDRIIRNANGDFYPIHAEMFWQKYGEVCLYYKSATDMFDDYRIAAIISGE